MVYEMSRLNIEYVVLSKRKLIHLVDCGFVSGWDDPRMPTIKGLRRRGYTARAINRFCTDIGVTRNENLIEYVVAFFLSPWRWNALVAHQTERTASFLKNNRGM
jgi:glutamyl/glutaminyl-tRNA synthetase